MNLLSRILEKRGIKSADELSSDEKADFQRWKGILSGGEVTLDKVVEFCTAQKSLIETQWENKDNSKEKNERLIIAHTIYSKICKVITSPQAEKEALERYLESLLLDK